MRSIREEPFRHTFKEPVPALFQIIIPGQVESSMGEANIIDMSPHGIKLNSALNIPEEAAVSFDLLIFFKLTGEELVHYGSIVWKKDKGASYDYGIELNVSKSEEKELIRQLKEYSRKEVVNNEGNVD